MDRDPALRGVVFSYGKPPEAVREFSERLKDYKTSKGTIQLPYSSPVPVELVSEIAGWCYRTGNHP